MIGIDPGLDGAVAHLDQDGALMDVVDIPVVEVIRNGKRKREVDFRQLARLLATMRDHFGRGEQAVVELVGPMPKQGVSSVFSFGKTYGGILGILAALDIPVSHVSPPSWKKTLAVRGGKDASRLRASELMPGEAWLWPLKKHDGRAEAALIGYYGYHHRKT